MSKSMYLDPSAQGLQEEIKRACRAANVPVVIRDAENDVKLGISRVQKALTFGILGISPVQGNLIRELGTYANIKFSGNVSEAQMLEAAEIAQAKEFICEKEEEYESPISQGGTNVSGGQKQRLSIARAIAKNPKVFLFDDSFSALDYKTDVTLRKALQEIGRAHV